MRSFYTTISSSICASRNCAISSILWNDSHIVGNFCVIPLSFSFISLNSFLRSRFLLFGIVYVVIHCQSTRYPFLSNRDYNNNNTYINVWFNFLQLLIRQQQKLNWRRRKLIFKVRISFLKNGGFSSFASKLTNARNT